MSETVNLNLSCVPETLPITLYLRAIESQRPDVLIKDEEAVALVAYSESEFEGSSAVRIQRQEESITFGGER